MFRTIYTVRDYKDPPKRCYLCQRYGHGAVTCTNKLVCSACGLQHRHNNNECKKKNNPTCYHCKGSHHTGSFSCDYSKMAFEIERKVEEDPSLDKKILYRELNDKIKGVIKNNQSNSAVNIPIPTFTIPTSNVFNSLQNENENDNEPLETSDIEEDSENISETTSWAEVMKKSKRYKKK